MDKRWLFIPVEVKVRELMAKVLLACHAVERGYSVVIGEAHAVRARLHQLPAGILLEKGVAPSKAESFAGFKQFGHRVVSWCEEGLVFFDDDDYVRRKIAGRDLLDVEYFFAWGPYQANVITDRFPDISDRMVCAGNVRMDLLRPEFREVFYAEARRLREMHEPFILVNTNFQHCNHRKGADGYVELIQQSGRIDTEEAERFTRGWIEHKRKIFEAFFSAIERVRAEYPSYKIVIRPHPGENHDLWRERLCHLPNVVVTHEGGVIPWLLASSVLIHNGCTTGIEAFLLKQPSIAYRPFVSDVYDQYLPNSVNCQADDEDALIQALRRLLVEKNVSMFVERDEWRQELRKYLAGFEERSACDIILDILGNMDEPSDMNRRPWFRLHRISLRGYLRAHTFLYSILRGGMDRGDYSRQKFPGVSVREMKEIVAQLQLVSRRFDGVSVCRLAEDVFALS